MALQSHSQFRRHIQSLLKQLKVWTSQLDILNSIISVVFALHTLRKEQNRVEMEPPIVRPPQVGGYVPSCTALSAIFTGPAKEVQTTNLLEICREGPEPLSQL